MRKRHIFYGVALAAGLGLPTLPVHAKDGRVVARGQGTNLLLQVLGKENDDWRVQRSVDCTTWTNVASFGALLSGDATNAPWRTAGSLPGAGGFYRGVKTAGLYDTTIVRTVSLTFTQANFSNLLALARTYNTNVYCSQLTLDNGATNAGVGARFRGNTSFTGLGPSGAPIKKSLAIEIDHSVTNASLMGYDHLNLNNAYLDYTILREPLYFNVMRKYTVCPACFINKLFINGANWGVYSMAQQQDGDLIKEYFPSNDGDRWRAPNMGGGQGGPGSTTSSALSWLGSNITSYSSVYELKTDYTNASDYSNAWLHLINACYVLNNTAATLLRDRAEDVLAVDRWLWFLAIENLFTDEDSYYYKGADYMFYYEPESGRIHPVEHDGNESSITTDYTLSPIYGYDLSTRPVLKQFLSNNELRQRYLAHMRTVLQESFHPTNLVPVINWFSALSADAIVADPKKGFTMATYTNSLLSLKQFVTNRYNFLMSSAYLAPLPPVISSVAGPATSVGATEIPFITATVSAAGTNGIDSVWLYYRPKPYGRFRWVQMFDDGSHGDGAASDGVFGAATANYPAGTKVRYYVEARSANAAKAAAFLPARAEQETFNYRVTLSFATNTPVVINEVMASNNATIADPQGEYDDWIELRNLTDTEVDLTGHYLSDEPNNPRKWQFPSGTTIPADGYLVVWADEDGTASEGLHASFKLSGSGEQIYFTDTDANLNQVLDYASFGEQTSDISYGRSGENADVWTAMTPTPGTANK